MTETMVHSQFFHIFLPENPINMTSPISYLWMHSVAVLANVLELGTVTSTQKWI